MAASSSSSTTETRCAPSAWSSRRASMGLLTGPRRSARCPQSSSHTPRTTSSSPGSAVAECWWLGPARARLESAGLLCEAGAEVEVLVRSPSVLWLRQDRQPATARELAGELSRPPTDVGGRLGWVAAAPDVYRLVPQRLRTVVTERCLRPRAGPWLKPPLADVTFTLDRRIVGADTGGKRRPGPAGRRERAVGGSHRARDRLPDRCWVVSLPVRANSFRSWISSPDTLDSARASSRACRGFISPVPPRRSASARSRGSWSAPGMRLQRSRNEW